MRTWPSSIVWPRGSDTQFVISSSIYIYLLFSADCLYLVRQYNRHKRRERTQTVRQWTTKQWSLSCCLYKSNRSEKQRKRENLEMSHLRSFYVSEKIEPISAGNQEIMALLLFRLSVVFAQLLYLMNILNLIWNWLKLLIQCWSIEIELNKQQTTNYRELSLPKPSILSISLDEWKCLLFPPELDIWRGIRRLQCYVCFEMIECQEGNTRASIRPSDAWYESRVCFEFPSL